MQAAYQTVPLLAERNAQARRAACPRPNSCLPPSLLSPALPFGGLLTPAAWPLLAEQHLCEVENVCEHRGWGTEPQLGLGP